MWAAKAAAEAEASETQRQPDFTQAEPQTNLTSSPTTSHQATRLMVQLWRQTNFRVNMGHRGVPGSSDGHSIVFGTPSRDKQ